MRRLGCSDGLGWVAVFGIWVSGCPQKDPEDTFRFGVDRSLAELELGEQLKVAFESNARRRARLIYAPSQELATKALSGALDVVLVVSESSIDVFQREGIPIRLATFAHEELIFIGPFRDHVGRYRAGRGHQVLSAIARTNYRYLKAVEGSAERVRHDELFRRTKDRSEPGAFFETEHSGVELVHAALDAETFALVKRSSLLLASRAGRVVHRVYKAGDPELVLRLVAVEVHPAKTGRPRRPTFYDFLMGDAGQKLIGAYGRERFGVPVFVPGAPEEGAGARVPLPDDWRRPAAPLLRGGASLP